MKGLDKLTTGMPSYMKKAPFWVGIGAIAIISTAGCAAAGIYDVSPIVEQSTAGENSELVKAEAEQKLAEERTKAEAEKKAKEERIAKEKKEAEEKAKAEEAKRLEEEKKTEEERKAAEAAAAKKAAEAQEQKAQPSGSTSGNSSGGSSSSSGNSQSSGSMQKGPSNPHYVHGYCKDGTAVYGDPTAKGKANACYGHEGWRDKY